MRRTRVKTAITAFIALGLLAGCVNLQRDYPVRKLYVLDVKQESPTAPPEDGPVIQVRFFKRSPGFAKSEFVYRTGETTYESDFYNSFYSLPSNQIRTQMVRWLKDSGHVRTVIDPASRYRPTHVVEGNVVELYGDFRDEAAPRAVIEIDFLVLDIRSSEPRIAFSNSYREEVPIPGPSASALVKGWEEGLKTILTSFDEDIAAQSEEGEAGEDD